MTWTLATFDSAGSVEFGEAGLDVDRADQLGERDAERVVEWPVGAEPCWLPIASAGLARVTPLRVVGVKPAERTSDRNRLASVDVDRGVRRHALPNPLVRSALSLRTLDGGRKDLQNRSDLLISEMGARREPRSRAAAMCRRTVFNIDRELPGDPFFLAPSIQSRSTSLISTMVTSR